MKRSYLFMLAVILSFSIACKKDTKEATETMDTEGTEEVTTENTETTTEKPKSKATTKADQIDRIRFDCISLSCNNTNRFQLLYSKDTKFITLGIIFR